MTGNLPEFCYKKTFWITAPIIVGILIGLFSYIDNKIDAVSDMAIENQRELDKRELVIYNNIPEIRNDVKAMANNQLLICGELKLACK